MLIQIIENQDDPKDYGVRLEFKASEAPRVKNLRFFPFFCEEEEIDLIHHIATGRD